MRRARRERAIRAVVEQARDGMRAERHLPELGRAELGTSVVAPAEDEPISSARERV